MMENESFNESLDGHVHVIPDNDLIEHIQHEACPCNPEWDRKINGNIYAVRLR